MTYCTSPQESCAVFLQESPHSLNQHSTYLKELQLTRHFGAEALQANVSTVLMDLLSPVTYCFVGKQYSHKTYFGDQGTATLIKIH